MIETKRLRLRPFKDSDAWDLYEQAKSPDVGPIAGWPPHSDVENSRAVIEQILSVEGNFAITKIGEGKVIGAIGLEFKTERAEVELKEKEAELGYWIGKPYWNNGYITEAARSVIEYGFSHYGLDAIWCGTYEGNNASKRVIEKLGFTYCFTDERSYCQLMDEVRVLHMYKLERQ